MSTGFVPEDLRAFCKTCLIVLLVDLLVFPPGLTAASITWNGGTGNYSDSSQWSCGGCNTFPNNSNPGGPFDATINSGGADVVNLDASGVVVNSMTIGGSGPSNTSTLNVTGGNNITLGTPSVSSGNVLAISNGGVLNVNGGGSATLELSGGAGALNGTGGQISVTDGGTLTLQNNTANGNSTFVNNGNISVVGSASAAQLVLSANPPAGATFTLSGSGTLTLGGLGKLVDTSGVESLNNDVNHTIAGDGLVSVQANIANGGTLHASTSGAALIVTSNNLTNWVGGTGTLTGGSYVVDNGAKLQLSNIGAGNSIQTLNNANVSVSGTGLLTGDGTTNALSGLTTITSTDSATGSGSASLTLSGSTHTLGALTNVANALNANNATTTLTVTNGATLTTGAFLNEANINFPGPASAANATVNVSGGSTLNVDSLTTSTNNAFASSTINITGSSLNVTHDLLQGGSGPNFSGGGDTLNLTNSTAHVGGNFANNNGLNAAIVNLSNSSLTVDGNFTQAQANGGFGQSQLNLTGGSTMTVAGLTNSTGLQTDGVTPQSLISITGGSSLTISGSGAFTNVSSGGVLSGGSYLIGTGSSLNYTGSNINTIDAGTVLTLDNAGSGVQGAVLNGGTDAISNSLTNVNGTLALQNGASLTLSGAPAGTFTVGPSGTLSLQNGSSLDVSAYNFTNVSGGVLSGGAYFVGTNSNLNYAAGQNAIGTIDAGTSVTLDNAGGGNQGSITYGGTDALSNSLTSVNGTLALQNGAGLTLSGAAAGTFTVGPNGTLSLQNGSNLDVSAYNFTNVSSGGVLSGGTYFIGSNSTLNYGNGQSNINTIDVNTSLTLDNLNGGATGSVTKGGIDALSNSLTANNGNLTLQNGASLTTGQGLTNSSSDTPAGSATANLVLINGSSLSLNNGASDLANTATSSNGNNATSTVSIGGGTSGGSTLTVNNLTNSATVMGGIVVSAGSSGSFAINGLGLSVGNAVANINLTGGSSLIVNGNAINSASGSNASATIALDGASNMTVGGTFGNTSASLGLTNGSTATITGLFTNDVNSSVNLDLTGSGGSILTTNGGFSNAGLVALNFDSTLNNTGTFTNSGNVNLFSTSTLTSTGLFDNTNGNLNLNGGGNTLFAAGFTNTGGNLFVAAGDTADFRTGGVDTFTNLSNGTLTAGSYNVGGTFDFDASAGTGGGQFQTINGASVVINGTGQIRYGANGSQGDALAAVTNMTFSTLSFNDAGAHTITPVPSGGVSTLTLTDSNLNLSSSSAATQTNLTIAGNLTNNSVAGNGQINIIGSNLTVDGTLTNSASNGQSSTINLSSAFLDNSIVPTGSTLTVTGALNNGFDGFVFLNGGGNTLTAAGLTNNGAISVGIGDTADFRTGGLDTYTNLANGTLTGGSLNVSGNFFYDASAGTGGGQILKMQGAGITLQGAGQILYGANGSQADALAALTSMTDSSLELDSLNAKRTITPGGGTLTLASGQLTVNSSTLEIAGSVVMNPDSNGFISGISLSGGNLKVDGSITNNASSFSDQTIGLSNLSTLTATGALINDSTVNLNGGGNQLFATGFTNNISGIINVGGGDTADFRNGGAGQFTNLANNTLTSGTYNLSGKLFYDTGSDASTYIQTISGASLALYNTGGANAPGAILFGSGAGIDALAHLGSLTGNATLTLGGQTETFNPNGSNGTFTVTASTLNLQADNVTPTALTIQGAFETTGSGGVNISGGSSLTVQGGVTIGGNTSLNLNGSGNSLSGTSLTNNGTLSVGAGDTADFRSGAGTLNNLTGNTLTGGTYNITGSLLYNTGMDGTSTFIQTLSGVTMTLGSTSSIGFGAVPTNALTQLGTLTNSSLTINGGSLAINPNGNGSVFTLDPSTLSLTGGTVLNIATTVDNTTGSSISLSGAGTTLTANGFTNDGSLTVGAGSTADFRNGGAGGSSTNTFTNLDGATGTLSGTSYDIAGTFQFDPTNGTNGGNILKVGASTTLTLDGTGGGAKVLYGPGSGTNALASLNEVAGVLNLYNGETRSFTPSGGTLMVDTNATMNLGGGFNGTGVANITGALTNAGTINLGNSGTGLTTTGSFLNTGTLNVNSSGNFVNSQGLNNLGGTINVATGATLDARTTGGFNSFSNLDGATGTLGGGGTFNIGGSFLFDPTTGTTGGNIYAIGAGTTLVLNGNTAQVLYGPGQGTNAVANLNEITGTLDLYNGANPSFTPNGGTLTVDSTGTMNLGGGFNGIGTANITGALTNNGTINLGNIGSGLTTTGAFKNTGTLNAFNAGDFVNSQGFNNAGGTVNIAQGAVLDARTTGGFNTFSNLDGTTGTLGGGGTFNVGGSFLFDPSSGTTGGNINVIGADTTLALTTAGAAVLYGPGSGTDALAGLTEVAGTLTLENGATHTFTPTTGTFLIDGQGTMNISGTNATATVTGALTNNGALNINGSLGTFVTNVGYEALNVSGAVTNGGTITMSSDNSVFNAGAGFTNNGTVGVSNASNTLNVTGALANNHTFTMSGSQNALNVSTDLSNSGTFTQNDNSTTTVNVSGSLKNLAGGTYTVGSGNLTAVTLAATNAATGAINVNGGGTLTASGFTNNGALAVLAGGTANFQGGAFTNLSGGTLTGGTYNIGGKFQFDASSGVVNNIATGTGVTLDAKNGGVYQVLSGNSNALANLAGNAGSLTLTNGVTLNTDTTANSGPGAFTNTGTVTTAGTGSNTLNVTGNIFNTSPGVVNLNGTGDKMTATGQFTNTGDVTLNGSSASVSSVGLDNQQGGKVTLAGNANTVSSTGTASNEGVIAFNGTNGEVSSTGNFTNAVSGMMTVEGAGNELFTGGSLLNSGGLTIGSGGIVTSALGVSQSGTVTIDSNGELTVESGEYDQTGGATTINQGGMLSASTFDLAGGTLAGGGAGGGAIKIQGNLTVDGGTLNPGDPQSIDVIGNYDQLAAGILDIDLAGPLGSPSADQVDVTGNVSLDGTLELTLLNGFDAAVGTQFDIVNWTGSETGNFSAFNNQTFDNGTRTFEEVINGNQVDLDVVSTASSATPEPSTLAMLFCAMLMGAGITWRVRRRQIE